MTLYTGTGDRGETALFDGSRVSKADARVGAYGEIDELNATLGVVLATGLDADLSEMVIEIQRDLFALGAQLADPGSRIAERVTKATVSDVDVKKLERWIDDLDARLPPLRRFVLPGGAPAGAVLHVARGVCRRAERRIVGLGVETLEPALLHYVNRLSDLLFVVARTVNSRQKVTEREW